VTAARWTEPVARPTPSEARDADTAAKLERIEREVAELHALAARLAAEWGGTDHQP
jgi:hypothetical protein